VGAWNSFFQGELGAAAALAGLLFVSVSVNQARILALGRTADRGIEALAMLFLVVIVASLPLIPGQSARLLGIEVFAVAAATFAALIPLQIGYLRDLDPNSRSRATYLVTGNRVSVAVIAIGGAVLVWADNGIGLYFLPPGILLSFIAAAANAWVLLIEINR
jgi:hypothetical protein